MSLVWPTDAAACFCGIVSGAFPQIQTTHAGRNSPRRHDDELFAQFLVAAYFIHNAVNYLTIQSLLIGDDAGAKLQHDPFHRAKDSFPDFNVVNHALGVSFKSFAMCRRSPSMPFPETAEIW